MASVGCSNHTTRSVGVGVQHKPAMALSDNKSRSILKTTVCLWSKTVSTKPCVKVKAWRSAPLHDSDSSVRCRRSSEVTLPCFTLRGTRVPINISVPSAVLFTTLSSILLPLSAAASLYNLRQLVK